VAVGGPLFAVIGAALDNFVESIACAILIACTAWIATAARRTDSSAEATGSAAPAPAAAH